MFRRSTQPPTCRVSADEHRFRYCILASKAGGEKEPCRWKRQGPGIATFVRSLTKAVSKVPRSHCGCPAPLARVRGEAWRSGSPTAGLPCQGMPGGVLSLLPLLLRSTLLQPRLPETSSSGATSSRQPPLSEQPGGKGRSLRASSEVPATLCASAMGVICRLGGDRSKKRDGSFFQFGHFSRIIPM
jgi:hypothetical protein